MEKHKIDLSGLAKRHKGVSPGLAAAYAEAVSVCLEKYHSSPLQYSLRDNQEEFVAEAAWNSPDSNMKGAWANDIDAVELAAYGLALAGIELTRGLVALRRAETKSGADYYLGFPGDDLNDLEATKRLEVSGVGAGSETTIQSRLKLKLKQAAEGASDIPAVASIVGFEKPLILSADLVEQ